MRTIKIIASVAGVALLALLASPAGADGAEKTADLSRQHQVAVSDAGVVRVGGGKLTTYREMAEDTVDLVADLLGERRRVRRSRSTRKLKLAGARGHRPAEPGTRNGHLAGRYGSLAAEVKALIAFDPELGEPIVGGHPYLWAEVVYAVRHEMATTLSDVLERRTRLHIFDRQAALDAAPAVAALIATELGCSDDMVAAQLDFYRQLCAAEKAAAHGHITANVTD